MKDNKHPSRAKEKRKFQKMLDKYLWRCYNKYIKRKEVKVMRSPPK
jgi:hypothetical protein